MVDAARTMAAEGKSASQIADGLSIMTGKVISRDAVTGRVECYGIELHRRPGGFGDVWAQAGGLATEMSRAGASATEIRDAIKAQLGLTVATDAVRQYAIRNGLALGRYVRPKAPPKPKAEPKPKAVKAPSKPRKPAKVKVPSISLIDPPFLPPLPLVREYVPTGRTPVTFLAAGEFVCKAFLPGEPITHAGLVCGNPVPEGRAFRFCGACGERMIVKAKEPKRSTFVTLGKRRAAA
ncbi:hypothetical protein LB518_22905 [Mesorhizobium sp. BR1-1-16]|uniref:hypothetical protein n=1 Tax=Mesorhizobium sp. BR1-1-16 TaxID=2876653 RepID=UPI001CCCD9D0|nr:hypothetical protein [Mesorhizobium sp. BR1-1-16]MBZ9939165.1 hypothetical protein [Mesorhizobium sp. BR1-1-16]